MAPVPHPCPVVSPNLTAALLLAARSHLCRLDLQRPTVGQILEATGATRSRAYELKTELESLMPGLERPAGRPPAALPEPVDAGDITGHVLDYVIKHPGCVHGHARRQRYSSPFCCFILELCEKNRAVPLGAFASAARVPLGTIKDWLRGGRQHLEDAACPPNNPATSGRIETILDQWKRWSGGFGAFCKHVSFNLRIPYGHTLIASILEQHGERTPRRRKGRSPDEKATRGAFETFFPGAQWVGDGKSVEAQIGQQSFTFNLELMVDAHSDAAVGVSIRDEEDSPAVAEAFDDGVQTTSEPPLCTLLDNRPSNHTDQVDQALGSSMRMRATKARPENKAHAEGAFGLFAQVVPLIAISATTPKEAARQLLELVARTWARTLNHKPQKGRKGRSRAQIYTAETPTPEQIEQARAALVQRCKQQELAQKTIKARQDPVAQAILDAAFTRLCLDDPQGNLRAAIARYPLDAIADGIATFEGKRQAHTLPHGADGRYLLGIVRNIAQQDEGLQITEALIRARLDARDRLLAPLHKARHSLLKFSAAPIDAIKTMTDYALDADRAIDRRFWLGSVAEHIRRQPVSSHAALLRVVSRRIHVTFAIPVRERQAAVRFLCSRVIPISSGVRLDG
jgi:hypothetical protein